MKLFPDLKIERRDLKKINSDSAGIEPASLVSGPQVPLPIILWVSRSDHVLRVKLFN